MVSSHQQPTFTLQGFKTVVTQKCLFFWNDLNKINKTYFISTSAMMASTVYTVAKPFIGLGDVPVSILGGIVNFVWGVSSKEFSDKSKKVNNETDSLWNKKEEKEVVLKKDQLDRIKQQNKDLANNTKAKINRLDSKDSAVDDIQEKLNAELAKEENIHNEKVKTFANRSNKTQLEQAENVRYQRERTKIQNRHKTQINQEKKSQKELKKQRLLKEIESITQSEQAPAVTQEVQQSADAFAASTGRIFASGFMGAQAFTGAATLFSVISYLEIGADETYVLLATAAIAFSGQIVGSALSKSLEKKSVKVANYLPFATATFTGVLNGPIISHFSSESTASLLIPTTIIASIAYGVGSYYGCEEYNEYLENREKMEKRISRNIKVEEELAKEEKKQAKLQAVNKDLDNENKQENVVIELPKEDKQVTVIATNTTPKKSAVVLSVGTAAAKFLSNLLPKKNKNQVQDLVQEFKTVDVPETKLIISEGTTIKNTSPTTNANKYLVDSNENLTNLITPRRVEPSNINAADVVINIPNINSNDALINVPNRPRSSTTTLATHLRNSYVVQGNSPVHAKENATTSTAINKPAEVKTPTQPTRTKANTVTQDNRVAKDTLSSNDNIVFKASKQDRLSPLPTSRKPSTSNNKPAVRSKTLNNSFVP